MNKKLKLISLFAIVFAFAISCSTNQYQIEAKVDSITIATFNIEWLGDGIDDKKDRSEVDYQNVAKVISMTNADIIAVQEIENGMALQRVLKFLPNYTFSIPETDYPQNVAYIYSKNIEFKLIGEYENLAVKKKRTRPGYLAYVKKGNFDFYMMNVHLKSTSRYDSTEELRQESFILRNEQSIVLNNWIDSVMSVEKERDFIILGDFNDNPTRGQKSYIKDLSRNIKLQFLTADVKSCKNPNWDNIDHIIVSLSAHKRLNTTSVTNINFYQALGTEFAKSISDHCPVVATFEISSSDND
jgi:endonuclease/exonuclease/phosphatase family metal-dependent hydrolase